MIKQNPRRINDRVKEIADSVKGLTRPPQFAPCRLGDVVSNVFQTLRILADEGKVALREEELDRLPVIRADESRLFNAVYNLVNNAIPEVPAGGSVTARGRLDESGQHVVLSVIDTGKGVSPEIRDSLFSYKAISRKVGAQDRHEDCEGCRGCPWRDDRGGKQGRGGDGVHSTLSIDGPAAKGSWGTREISLASPCARGRVEAGREPLLQREVKPHGPAAAWLRNLVRPGLRPNGPSNSASRHR